MPTPRIPIRAELLMIGTELLLGQIQDTNAGYMARTLADHGVFLYQKTTVGDNRERIRAALEAALERADVVLCSGGLGPTEDDITRECVAEVFGTALVYHEPLFEAIRTRFARHGRTVTDNNKRQAMVPEGAEPIPNPNGTAPGLYVDDARGVVCCMPGVPGELRAMLEQWVLPRLRARFGVRGVIHSRVLKVCGVGESRVDALVGDLIVQGDNPTVGLLASPDVVRIRIAAHADTLEAARHAIAPVEAELRARLDGLVMGTDDDTLESVVDAQLAARGWTLAVAETDTGGMLAQRLVAQGARRLAGARVWPGRTGTSEQETFDLAHEIMVDYATQCAVALLADPAHTRSFAALVTPDARVVHEVGLGGVTARQQLRTSVIALEQFRRLLAGGVTA